jgi:hypothetical protein
MGSLASFSVNPKVRHGINSMADSESPLKWTEILTQSSLDDFIYQTGV